MSSLACLRVAPPAKVLVRRAGAPAKAEVLDLGFGIVVSGLEFSVNKKGVPFEHPRSLDTALYLNNK